MDSSGFSFSFCILFLVIIVLLNIFVSRNVYPEEWMKADKLCTDANSTLRKVNMDGLEAIVYCKNGAVFEFDAGAVERESDK